MSGKCSLQIVENANHGVGISVQRHDETMAALALHKLTPKRAVPRNELARNRSHRWHWTNRLTRPSLLLRELHPSRLKQTAASGEAVSIQSESLAR